MPKQIPLSEKREWLKQYEDGTPAAQIARKQEHSLRVVRRGIDEARSERDGTVARADIVKDALRNHQRLLMEVIDKLMRLTDPLPPDMELRREASGVLAPIGLPGGRIYYNRSEGLQVELADENTRQWKLLKEHLKRAKLWRMLEQWKKQVTDDMRTRIVFEAAIRSLVQSETNLTITQVSTTDIRKNFLYPSVMALFYQVSIRRAVGILDGTNPEIRIVASDDGYVRHGQGGTELAHCPGKQDKCKEGLLRALKKIPNLPETAKIQDSTAELKKVSGSLKEAIEDIQLMGMIPGRCRICNRISL